MLVRVKQFMSFGWEKFRRLLPNKRFQVFALILFCAFVTSGVLIATAPAQASIMSSIFNGIIQFVVYLLLLLATLFIQITIFFLKFFILIAGYNNYINAPVVLLGWNMVRDVANMFFVVILLVIAFGTILGLEQYEWRKSLVKLILAAILVNFSNLILQLIIDVAQVFMITFLNAVAGAAGGNLINMFNFDKILNLSVGNNPTGGDQVQLKLLAAGVMALVFAAVAMFTLFAYVVVLVFRVVLLWVSIILSPLAFIFSVLPQTKGYADEFWKEFTNHVLAGPVMVFFLWLAFATFGGGGITQHLEEGHPQGRAASLSQANAVEDISGQKPGASINEAASWENMSNFIVAIAFLWVGIERVQKLGVRGGGLTSGAIDFGKKVATVASGYAAGRWLVGKGADLGSAGLKKAAYYAPVVGGEKWEKRGKIMAEAAKGWYYGKGFEVTKKGEAARDRMTELQELQAAASPDGQKALQEQVATLQASRAEIEGNEELSDEQKAEALQNIDKQISETEALKTEAMLRSPEAIEAEMKKQEAILKKEVGGGIFGALARKGIALDKQVGKTEQQAEYRRKILRKRTGSEAGGTIMGGMFQFGMGVEKARLFGIPLGRKFGDEYKQPGRDRDAQDRIERGWYAAEEARSAAKDYDVETEGRLEVLRNARLKYDVKNGTIGYEFGKGTIAERIEERKMKGEGYDSEIRLLELSAREGHLAKAEEFMKNLENDPTVKETGKKIDALGREIDQLGNVIEALKGAEAAQRTIDEFRRFESGGREEQIKKLREEDESATDEEIRKIVDGIGEELEEAYKEAMKDVERQRKVAQKSGGSDADFENIQEAIAAYEARVAQGSTRRNELKAEKKSAYLAAIERAEATRERGKQLPTAWKHSRNEALKSFKELFFTSRSKHMVNEAAQKHIWDAEGIDTPNDAEIEIYERLASDFKGMDYNATTAAVKGHMAKIMADLKAGKTPSLKDRGISMALLKQLHADSWVDDAIPITEELQKIGVTISQDMKEQFGKELERQVRSMKVRGTGTGKAVGGGPSLRSLGSIMSQALGGDARGHLEGLRTSKAGEGARLLQALRGSIGEIDKSLLRSAGIDATQTNEQLAKEISDYIVKHHKDLISHV